MLQIFFSLWKEISLKWVYLTFISVSCDPGNEDKNGVCVKCAVGYFKPEKKADSCTKCPPGFITSDVGSTSQTDCSVRKYDTLTLVYLGYILQDTIRTREMVDSYKNIGH